MSDQFQHHAQGLESPASNAFSITPNDVTMLSSVTRAIYVGVGGTLRVEMKSGSVVSFANLPDGALLPIRAAKVLAATTASAIVGLA